MTSLNLAVGLTHAMAKSSWGNLAHPASGALPSELVVPAARNEVVGAQVRLYAREDFVVVTDHANWLHSLGHLPRVRIAVTFPSLPAGAVETLLVGYVEGDDHGEWMETLHREGHAEVPAHRPQPVYLRIHVPVDLAPGEHAGMVRVFTQQGYEDETLAWEGTVTLAVADVAIPDPRDWGFHLDLWQLLTAIARQHRVALWSDAHLAIIDRYYASLAAVGQKAVTLVVTEDPWSGWHAYRNRHDPAYLTEHAVVAVRRAADGALAFDYTVLDRLLALAAGHGIDREIEVFGLLGIWQDEEYGFGRVIPDAPDAVRIRCFDEATGAMTYLRTAVELQQFIGSLRDHFAELGVIERVRIAADEPGDPEALARSLRFIEEVAPGLKYKLAITKMRHDHDWPADVTDYSVGMVPLARQLADLGEFGAACRARGGKVTYYLCCREPYPNNFVHSPLVEGELIGWFTHRTGLDGFLRWAFCLWTSDPWRRVTRQSAFDYLPAGDMYFVMPGPDGAPVETLRYESLRAAVQDYELLRLVESRLPAAEAADLITRAYARVFRTDDMGDFVKVGGVGATAARSTPATVRPQDLYSLDPADFVEARRLLLEGLAGRR